MKLERFKVILGGLLLDSPLFMVNLILCRFNHYRWINIKNRHDQLINSSIKNTIGVTLDQPWTSNLYLPTIMPAFGQWLFMQAMKSHQINYLSDGKQFSTTSCEQKNIQVSFIIGHRGPERVPLLLKTLSSIAVQKDCLFECIVVEQDKQPLLNKGLPNWVKHIFTPVDCEMPFSRSLAFNIGAQHAKGQCLILHDNDMLISQDYAYHVFKKYQQGYEFITLKRFIFFLNQASTSKVIDHGIQKNELEFETIMQNSKGGGSIGAARSSYFDIGGFDERFIGWGGEDNEFWERALTRNVWEYGFIPLVHLWHSPQTEKLDIENSDTKLLYNRLTKEDPLLRIEWLNNTQVNTNFLRNKEMQ